MPSRANYLLLLRQMSNALTLIYQGSLSPTPHQVDIEVGGLLELKSLRPAFWIT